MVLAKNIPKGMEFVNFLEWLISYNYNVLLAVPRDCAPEQVPLPKLKKVWFWETLIDGGKPISPSELAGLLARCPRSEFNYFLE